MDNEVVGRWASSFPFHACSLATSPHTPCTVSSTSSLLPCRWIPLPSVTCCKLLESLWYRSGFFFFQPPCLPVGVSLTTGIKEPLQTGWGTYLKQQACHQDYFKWELESNCCRVPARCWLWVIMHWFSGEERWSREGLPCCSPNAAHRWIEEWGNKEWGGRRKHKCSHLAVSVIQPLADPSYNLMTFPRSKYLPSHLPQGQGEAF